MRLILMALAAVLFTNTAVAQATAPAETVPTRKQNATSSDCNAGGKLTGTVFGYTQNPIRKAEIWVIGTKLTARTDSHGRFELQNLTPGSYALTFSKKGFALGKAENVTIVCGHTSVVLLTFHRVPPPLIEKIDVPYCTLSEEKINPKSSSSQRTFTLDEIDKTPHGHSVTEMLLSQ